MNTNISIKIYFKRTRMINMSILLGADFVQKSIYQYLDISVSTPKNFIDFIKYIFNGLQFYRETSLITNPGELQGVRIHYER
jgi:hypothetical protein